MLAAVLATVKGLTPAAQLLYIRTVKGWDLREMSAVTIVFEGSRLEVSIQKKQVWICVHL